MVEESSATLGAAAAVSTTILPLGFGGLVTAAFHPLCLSLHVDEELGQLIEAFGRHVDWVIRSYYRYRFSLGSKLHSARTQTFGIP